MANKSKRDNNHKSNTLFKPFPYFDCQASLSAKTLGKSTSNSSASSSVINSILFPISSFFISCLKWKWVDPFACASYTKGECLLEVCGMETDAGSRVNDLGYLRLTVKSYAQIVEYYWNGSFGKSTLSRGLPSWFKRHFYKTEYSPKGLVELKKHNAFSVDMVDWYDEEWQAFQDLVDPVSKNKNTYLGQEEFVLFAEEAFFLLFALDSLNVRNAATLHLYSVQELWTLFRKQSLPPLRVQQHLDFVDADYTKPSKIPNYISTNDFAVQYAVYHHFRSKGWTPRSGLNMGFDFLLYKKGPQYTHAAFCVWIVRKDQVVEPRILAGKVRVAASVKKKVLLCFVDVPKTGLDSPACLKNFVVHEFKIGRWIPDRSIDQNPTLKPSAAKALAAPSTTVSSKSK